MHQKFEPAVTVVVRCVNFPQAENYKPLYLLVADEPGTPYSRRSDKSSSEPGDVELMERTMQDGTSYGMQQLLPSAACACKEVKA